MGWRNRICRGHKQRIFKWERFSSSSCFSIAKYVIRILWGQNFAPDLLVPTMKPTGLKRDELGPPAVDRPDDAQTNGVPSSDTEAVRVDASVLRSQHPATVALGAQLVHVQHCLEQVLFVSREHVLFM